MGTYDRQLVVVDFPGIKRFVFGTDRLVEIRGASALLDRLNRTVIPERISQHFGPSRSRCIFAGGGAGQFFIEDSPEKVREAFNNIRGEVYRESGGSLWVVIGIAALNDDYALVLQRAFLDLERNKHGQPFDTCSPLHNGFVRECESCSAMAAEIKEFAGETRLLCRTCARKEKAGRDRGLWEEFSGYLTGHGIDPDQSWEWRPKDFEEIGERCEARRGYTALVFGDGNAMGRVVKQICRMEQFERFSKAIDEAVREACHEALWLHCKKVDGKIPADILLLGGDDVMVYLAADLALPFAIDMARLFENKTRAALTNGDQVDFFSNILGKNGLTLSIGIAYGRSHTPLSIMADQAEELLKSAKTQGTLLAGTQDYIPACIDFHLTSRFNQVKVADSRKQHLMLKTARGEDLHLFMGPYTLEQAEDLMAHARNLKQSSIPSTRLHRLGEAPFMGKVNATIESLTLYGRCSRGSGQRLTIWNALDRFGCMQNMPWRQEGETQSSTVLVDLVQIAQFIKKEDVPNAP